MPPPRPSQTFTISLPKELAQEIDRMAAAENRSRSELMREAFRQYLERRRRWERIFVYGRRRAKAIGLRSEEEVARAVEDHRRRKAG